jgi:fructose-1,6-bisphosphatase/inositol monophosphatase family enzyme
MLTQEHIDLVKQTLEDAREIALLHLNNPGVLANEFKDIKTLVDQRMNEFIIGELSKTDFPILSEESKLHEKISTGWILDPLDGTLNFTRNFSFFSISIAFVENFLPVHGFVLDISKNVFYSTDLNKQANKNNIVIKVSEESEICNSVLVTGFPSGASYNSQDLLSFVNNVQEFKKIRALGCASLMICLVAEGIFDVYYEKGIYLWDIAAGLAIVEAAGGMYKLKKMSKPFQYEVFVSNQYVFNKVDNMIYE